ncbi:hypothetical protein BDW71DRAFT_195510 [Aspergillus fruticulosus]
MLHTTICRTTYFEGLVLGHEGIRGVETFSIASCGVCISCRQGFTRIAPVAGGHWGTSSMGRRPKYVRIPHAASSLHKLPTNIDAHAAVAFAGALPKGHEYGTINANVQTEARSPLSEQALLACHTQRDLQSMEWPILRAEDAMERLDALSGEHGFESVIEAADHGQKDQLALNRLWDHNISIRTRLMDTTTIPTLIRLYHSQKIDPSQLVTYNSHFREIIKAYEIF